jgi:hypothetical protein
MRHEAQPSLVKLLEEQWTRLRRETVVSGYVFATAVREHYEANIARHAFDVEWSQHPDLVTRMKRDAEKVSRWFSDDVNARFPVDALESFIAAFPADRRFALQVELAMRQGMLVFPVPVVIPFADGDNLGRIGKECGEAIMAISAMLADGRIDECDAALADAAQKQIHETMAVLAEMNKRIENQTCRKSPEEKW